VWGQQSGDATDEIPPHIFSFCTPTKEARDERLPRVPCSSQKRNQQVMAFQAGGTRTTIGSFLAREMQDIGSKREAKGTGNGKRGSCVLL